MGFGPTRLSEKGGVATDESVNEEAHRRTGRSKSEFVYMLHSAKNIDSAMQTMLTDWLICMTRECFSQLTLGMAILLNNKE